MVYPQMTFVRFPHLPADNDNGQEQQSFVTDWLARGRRFRDFQIVKSLSWAWASSRMEL